jgi:hypothetical protein
MTISFARRQLPPAIIRHPISFYIRFTIRHRDVDARAWSAGWKRIAKRSSDGPKFGPSFGGAGDQRLRGPLE